MTNPNVPVLDLKNDGIVLPEEPVSITEVLEEIEVPTPTPDETVKFEDEKEPEEMDIVPYMIEFNKRVDEGTEEYINLNVPINIPLGNSDDLAMMIEDSLKGSEEMRKLIIRDLSSVFHRGITAADFLTNNNERLKEELAYVEDTSDFVHSIEGAIDTRAVNRLKRTSDNPIVLDKENGRILLSTMFGGVRKIQLWNSGFYILLKPVEIPSLSAYYQTVDARNAEYGREFGGFYYLFAHLTLVEHIVNMILPHVIMGSNYSEWQNTEKLMNVMSIHDFQIVLWAMGCGMYPGGVDFSFICSEPDCGYVHTEKIDLKKLRLMNRQLVNPEMVDLISKKSVTDADLAEYRKVANLDVTKTVVIDDGDRKVPLVLNLYPGSVSKFIALGRDFNAELRKNCNLKQRTDINNFHVYNRFRCYVPWIESVEFTNENDVPYTIPNEEERVSLINNLADMAQMYCPDFEKTILDYMKSSKISHTAFFMPKCPHCGTVPKNSYKGYVPYDAMRTFFFLIDRRLFAITQRETS